MELEENKETVNSEEKAGRDAENCNGPTNSLDNQSSIAGDAKAITDNQDVSNIADSKEIPENAERNVEKLNVDEQKINNNLTMSTLLSTDRLIRSDKDSTLASIKNDDIFEKNSTKALFINPILFLGTLQLFFGLLMVAFGVLVIINEASLSQVIASFLLQ